MSKPETTSTVGDQWTPQTLMDACVHIRSLDAEIKRLRAEVISYEKMLTRFEDAWFEQKAKVREMQNGK